ncbi:putative transcriptional regulator [Bosea sp. BE271]|uniref:MucR family transcriptional regulator n=1 Tax=Bosea TaxID=85413 RepID=UPI0028589031|nr:MULTISPECIES: MucR family transcriptional regulator [Bosea]MDR6828983.1 putative transcriptional regulator [Bosea robiniae]MDR6895867.1 putative transcriptional regulator [Bosea sp. BE109]MDR7139263.1 putative transcriptional regulator [Bosea sp. BE168]MDR7175963.1 putative transcriptional regulator [Bosea sp. BE271]
MAEEGENVIALVADIVSAYVSNNSVPAADLPGLIATTHAAITGLGAPPASEVEDRPNPVVSIKKSITSEFLICLEDGKKFKSLKRHLRTAYNMSPEDYRARWGLPADYPMVAPAYAEARSALAKQMGLGQQRRKSPVRGKTSKAN